jgi:hypothetical protein
MQKHVALCQHVLLHRVKQPAACPLQWLQLQLQTAACAVNAESSLCALCLAHALHHRALCWWFVLVVQQVCNMAKTLWWLLEQACMFSALKKLPCAASSKGMCNAWSTALP